jgi:hypothetical protein
MKNILSIILFVTISFNSIAQSKSQLYPIKKIKKINPLAIKDDFEPKVTNLEMPSPGSEKYRLKEIKNESGKRFSRAAGGIQSWEENPSINPTILHGLPIADIVILPLLNDTFIQHKAGGIPNDNTLAISNGGLLLASYNSSIFAWDTEADTALFKTKSLHNFSSEFTINDKYDPKLLYDPTADRFILVFLNGRLSTDNQIIVAFSTTNNPIDDWNLYAIPGNPLNDTTWFDYPAIAISENELFLTGNQLRDNEPWQTGFEQTLIWQISKADGYNGLDNITTRLWSDINDNGLYIRNLNPMQGGSYPTGPNTYFLSTKNFAILSDSIYMLEITGELNDPSTELKIQLGYSNTSYGTAPDGKQDHEDGLSSNDARILGGFIENNEIQFVLNSIDPNSGFAGVYHGFISNVDNEPTFSGKILSDDSLDLAYPNIAYTGTHDCSQQSVITVNHTSLEHGAGYSAVQFRTDGEYSELITLKKGEGHIDRLNGTERWGDYSGIQKKYNEPGSLWCAGFYARNNNVNYTWISKLSATEEVPRLAINVVDSSETSKYGLNDGAFELEIIGGIDPIAYQWSNSTMIDELSQTNLTPGPYSFTVSDNNNCVATDSINITEALPNSNVFPNPSMDYTNIYFELDAKQVIYISLYDTKGTIIKELYVDEAKKGSNVFTFSLQSLSIGAYILKVKNETSTIVEEKIVKY